MMFRVMISAVLLVLLTSGSAGSGQLIAGSVPVAPSDEVRCIVVNLGSGTADEITIDVVFNKFDGTFSSRAGTICSNVEPERSCRLSTTAISGNDSMFCRVTNKGGKLRGTLCNVTKGLCTGVGK